MKFVLPMFARPQSTFCTGTLATAIALAGSARGQDFPEPYNNEPDKDAHPPAAADAAEPDVQNPIAMAWDYKGRMWVAENYTYAEREKRFDLALRDRVLIFEDSDWDGVADNRSVFVEDLKMLTSVEVVPGGVYVMCPPQLLFIPDADGDDQPDGPPQVLLDGFDVADSNYHNFANDLRWGPDGWLYGRDLIAYLMYPSQVPLPK